VWDAAALGADRSARRIAGYYLPCETTHSQRLQKHDSDQGIQEEDNKSSTRTKSDMTTATTGTKQSGMSLLQVTAANGCIHPQKGRGRDRDLISSAVLFERGIGVSPAVSLSFFLFYVSSRKEMRGVKNGERGGCSCNESQVKREERAGAKSAQRVMKQGKH
jgi:hypothetical protein